MKKNVIEKGVLARKIKEHFLKNPKASSVMIKTKMEGGKKFWRVTREGKDFRIVEVKTSKEEFILEMELPQVKRKTLSEASSQFASISRAFSDAIVTMDHMKLSAALQQIQPLVGQLTDPKEKEQAGAIMGTLTSAVNSTTKSGSTTQVSPVRGTSQLTTSKKISGRVVKEEGEEPSKKKDSTIEPEEPDDEVGIETSSDEQESDPETDTALSPNKSEEETLFLETLKGQTIQSSDLQVNTNGGVLTLQFVSVEAPLEFEWKNNGKIMYRHKGRPYVIKAN